MLVAPNAQLFSKLLVKNHLKPWKGTKNETRNSLQELDLLAIKLIAFPPISDQIPHLQESQNIQLFPKRGGSPQKKSHLFMQLASFHF